jgi:acyl-CoA synthetase (AMP-forming)/AMP-acid ligase II
VIETRNLGAVFHPDFDARVALVDCLDWDAPRSVTHAELNAMAGACARGLLARGLRRGERVAILAANRSEFLVAFLGCLQAGLVAVPVNHRFPADTIAFIFQDARVRLAIHDARRRPLLPPDVPAVDMDDLGEHGFQALLQPGPFEPVSPADDEDAMILYTSGSTGRPKGVRLGHAGHLWALRARLKSTFPLTEHRLLVAAPLYHMNALCVTLFAIAGGACEVLMPQFDAVRYLHAIERFGCTWITSVPTMIAMCMRHPEVLAATDLSSVRIIRMGSAPISPKLLARVKQVFPGAGVMNGYGTTEAGPVVFGPRDGRPPPDLSVGWPSPGVEIRLVDGNGDDAPQGVLWQRTPANMRGYLNLAQKTREVLTEDGWYISGDVFRREDDGAYYFVGRSDDMFNCSGENIYPGEVEAVLVSHPAVAEACVVPVEDEIRGAKPVAFVVPVAGAEVDEDIVKAHALANAPAYQHPRRVEVLSELPLAGPGKVDRKALLQRARQTWSGEALP